MERTAPEFNPAGERRPSAYDLVLDETRQVARVILARLHALQAKYPSTDLEELLRGTCLERQ